MKRRSTLTGIAHKIAMRFGEISKLYIERGESTPPEILAHEFDTICAEYEDMHDGALSTADMQTLALHFVPRAIDRMTKRMQAQNDFCHSLARSVEAENARAVV
jgi:hypothetical protein